MVSFYFGDWNADIEVRDANFFFEAVGRAVLQ